MINQKKHTIAVLGANGRISNQVALAFAQAGWKVIAISRNGISKSLEGLENIEMRAADAKDRNALIQATNGAGFIFNGINPLYTDWEKLCLPVARNVIAATRANQCIHLFPGNVYHFGSKLPAILSEQTSALPDHRKAHIRLEMEQLFEQASQEHGVRTILVRAGDFFGGAIPGSWFDLALVSKIQKGVFTYPGNKNIAHAWAYLPDLAQVFVQLAEKADQLGSFERFHFSGTTLTGRQFHAVAEEALDKKLKLSGLPTFIFTIGGVFTKMMREISEVAYLWHKPHQLNGDKLKLAIGNIRATPIKLAFCDAVRELGKLPMDSPAREINAIASPLQS